jgi:hypothetical protein
VGYPDHSFNGRDATNGIDALGVAIGALADVNAMQGDLIINTGRQQALQGDRVYWVPVTAAAAHGPLCSTGQFFGLPERGAPESRCSAVLSLHEPCLARELISIIMIIESPN